jgi:hypothetical protein
VEVLVLVLVGVESQVEVTERAFPTLPDWLWKEDGREVCIWQREPNSITHCKLDVHTTCTRMRLKLYLFAVFDRSS